MCGKNFKKIFNFDFANNRAKKLCNSSYLEELTGLLESVSSKIDNGEYYYFDSEYYLDCSTKNKNASFAQFINEFKCSFFDNDNNKIHIIMGEPGTGKTLFFEKGIQMLVRRETKSKEKYIKLGVDFANISQKKDVEYYIDFIYKKLRANAIDAIRRLSPNSLYKEFIEEYKEYEQFPDTENAKLFPVLFFCVKIYEQYKKPCIILFDNIDLSCAETQKNVFKAVGNISNALHNFMKARKHGGKYCAYFAMRPETHLRSQEAALGRVINFPLPNILKISLKILETVLLETAKDFDENRKLACNITFIDIISLEKRTVTKYCDVAEYFIEILNHFLIKLWKNDVVKRLGTCEEFHCDLVNCNVRTYLKYLADTLANGGFKPFTEEFNKGNGSESHYTTYSYVEMMIRGRWIVHPGNKLIDGEGGNKAPIVFNLFDTSLWENTKEKQVQHFMLYIRILQYLGNCIKGQHVLYDELKNQLILLFDEKHIERAVKKLVHVRLIYSFGEGEQTIAELQDYSDVTLNRNTPLCLNPMKGFFYIEKLICEFEYLYQMAVTSIMPEEYVEMLKSNYASEKEQTVACFLKGIFEILKINFGKYSTESIYRFKTLFCQEDGIYRPYRKMLNAFIGVMENKVGSAEYYDTRKLPKLREILKDAQDLKKEVEDYFAAKLGDT